MKRKKEIEYIPSNERYDIVHDGSELNQKGEAFTPGDDAGTVVVHHVVTALLIGACLAIGTWTYLTYKSTSFFAPVADGSDKSLQPYMIKAQSDRLHKAIQVYYKINAKYPASLDDVVAEKILEPSDPYYPPNSEFRYRKLASSYSLEVITIVNSSTKKKRSKK